MNVSFRPFCSLFSVLVLLFFMDCGPWSNIGPKYCSDDSQCDVARSFRCNARGFCVRIGEASSIDKDEPPTPEGRRVAQGEPPPEHTETERSDDLQDRPPNDRRPAPDTAPDGSCQNNNGCSCFTKGRTIWFEERHKSNKGVVRVLQHPNVPNVLFSAGQDGKVIIWDVSTLEKPTLRHSFEVGGAVTDFDIDSKGQYLLLAIDKNGGSELALYDVNPTAITGKNKRFSSFARETLQGQTNLRVRFVRPDIRALVPAWFAVGNAAGNVSLWEVLRTIPQQVRTMRKISSGSSKLRRSILSLVPDPSSTERFLTADSDGDIRLWRISMSGRKLDIKHTEKHSTSGQSIAVLSLATYQGSTLFFASGGKDETIRMWTLDKNKDSFMDRKVKLQMPAGILGRTTALSFERVTGNKGIRLYAGGEQGIVMWESKSFLPKQGDYAPRYTDQQIDLFVKSLTINPSRDILFGSMDKGQVWLWTCLPTSL